MPWWFMWRFCDYVYLNMWRFCDKITFAFERFCDGVNGRDDRYDIKEKIVRRYVKMEKGICT